MKKSRMILILIFVMALALAGCGDKAQSPAPEQTPAPEYYMLLLNIEGRGQIADAPEGEDLVFNDRFPMKSSQATVDDQTTYVIGARADEGSVFVKWTKNDKDYSTDPIISVRLKKDTVLVAVFDYLPAD